MDQSQKVEIKLQLVEMRQNVRKLIKLFQKEYKRLDKLKQKTQAQADKINRKYDALLVKCEGGSLQQIFDERDKLLKSLPLWEEPCDVIGKTNDFADESILGALDSIGDRLDELLDSKEGHLARFFFELRESEKQAAKK